MKRHLLIGALIAVVAPAAAQMTIQSVSPSFTRGFMLICRWDHTDTHRQVRLYGHGDYENAELKIIERHSEETIYQTKLFKRESEESPLKISISLERYSGHIDWSESTGHSHTGYCSMATERLF